jgi:hypothetical protein
MINPPSTNFAEQWINQYTQLNKAISYKSFDFNGIKRSLLDYLSTYHPEHFNNLTETDELLPLIELFAYIGELYAYRADVNTQEHILSSVTRKSSAIQIANMLGYSPSRRTAGIGLVKITSVATTESVLDVNGNDLQNKVIKWSDQTNARWKPQFTAIINRVLNSSAGVLSDSDKTQVENITFERYTMNTATLVGGVFKFSTTVNGLAVPMEIVGATLGNGAISELDPTSDRPLDVLYANDGFGDSSPTSGYMFLAKQGVLSSAPIQFDGSTVNLTQPVNATGINDTDVWLNSVDASGNFLSKWEQVDNIAYNSSSSRNTYQVLSREDDQVTLVFGDGNYSAIPSGNFQVWYRTSLELDSTIPISAISNQTCTLTYSDLYGNTQTFTCTFSLTTPITTSSSSESLAKLKQAIPGVFYTQDRMVNAQDHQNYLLQDPSIVKVKAVNRTFAGHSKYSSWYDGSESYENVKIFSDDGVLYLADAPKLFEVLNPNLLISPAVFVDQSLTPVLVYPELWTAIQYRLGPAKSTPRLYFMSQEQDAIVAGLRALVPGASVKLYWQGEIGQWVLAPIVTPYGEIITSDVAIEISLLASAQGWLITLHTSKLIMDSPSTRFWQYSSITGTDYDTTNPTRDTLTILKANPNRTRNGTLSDDVKFNISNNVQLQAPLPYQASFDLSKVQLVDTSSALTSMLALTDLLETECRFTFDATTDVLILPREYIPGTGYGDIASVVGLKADGTIDTSVTYEYYPSLAPNVIMPLQQIRITSRGNMTFGDQIIITMRDWVYFSRVDSTVPYTTVPQTTDTLNAYIYSSTKGQTDVVRYPGRTGLNFLWQHFTDQFEIINPARTNITDLYVVTKQYYTDHTRWLQSNSTQPTLPSVQSLNLAYSKYIQKAMMSDEIVLRPGKFKTLFGAKSDPTLRAVIQLVLAGGQQAAKDSIKQEIVALVRQYFDIANVQFGDTFFFSNLSAYLHANSKYTLGSVLLVPLYPGYQFGDLYELTAAPDEIFVADISLSDIQIVDQLNASNLRQ